MDTQLDSLAWIAKKGVTVRELAQLQRDLTIQPKSYEGDPPPPIELLVDGGKCWGMPVRYGLKFFQTKMSAANPGEVMAAITDKRESGRAEVYTRLPSPRSEVQAEFFQDVYARTAARPVALAEAGTGLGKTVAALNTIAKLGRSALVICPTIRIADQWRRMAKDPDILGLPGNRIGRIQAGTFDFRGKAITIAVIHNITKAEKIPSDFYNAFGVAVWDEAHNLGARTFSRSMGLVRARHKLAMSATPERRDGCTEVFTYHFGAPCVWYRGEAMRARCRVFDYQWKPRNGISGKPLAIMLRIVRKNDARTMMCRELVLRLYRAGRNILCLGDEIGFLQDFVVSLMDAGVPGDEVGLYARTYYDENGKRKTISDDALDYVAENCRIIVATYQLAKEGTDIPRLDAGIDLTPKARGKQAIGRIRRPMYGKPIPLWLTIRDRGISKLEGFTDSRLRDYKESNVEVIESGKA